MIAQEDTVAWGDFMSQLEEAHSHLGTLLDEAKSLKDYAEPELRIDLGHVFAHLNRAWNRRNTSGELSEEQWEEFRAFPSDLDPIA